MTYISLFDLAQKEGQGGQEANITGGCAPSIGEDRGGGARGRLARHRVVMNPHIHLAQVHVDDCSWAPGANADLTGPSEPPEPFKPCCAHTKPCVRLTVRRFRSTLPFSLPPHLRPIPSPVSASLFYHLPRDHYRCQVQWHLSPKGRAEHVTALRTLTGQEVQPALGVSDVLAFVLDTYFMDMRHLGSASLAEEEPSFRRVRPVRTRQSQKRFN